MEEEVVNISKAIYQDNVEDYLEVDLIVNGEKKARKLRYDDKTFEKYLNSYMAKLSNNKNKYQKETGIFENIKNIYSYLGAAYLFIFFLAAAMSIFYIGGITNVRLWFAVYTLIGIGGGANFFHLKNKYKNVKAIKGLNYTNKKLDELNEIIEFIENKKKQISKEKHEVDKNKERPITKQNESRINNTFSPDVPSFLRNQEQQYRVRPRNIKVYNMDYDALYDIKKESNTILHRTRFNDYSESVEIDNSKRR